MIDEMILNLALKKQNNIILSFDSKISKNSVFLLKSDTIKNCADNKFYERLKLLDIPDVQTFLKIFKEDCNLYMLENDKITINSYLNFKEIIKK